MNMEEPRSLDHLLIQICRLLYSRGREGFHALGLHRGQAPVILALCEEEGRTQSDLADRVHVTPPTMTKMLQRMEKGGFVERRSDPEDHRVSRVYLTQTGREIHGDLQRLLDEFNRITCTGLDPEEREVLERLLLHVRQNLLEAAEPDPAC